MESSDTEDSHSGLFKDVPQEINSAIKPNNYVYVFFSFDLVESTQLKNKEKQKWIVVVQSFYNLIKTTLVEKFTNIDDDFDIQIWKYIGDEVLFYLNLDSVSKKEYFFEIPNIVLETQAEVALNLKSVCKENTISYIPKIKSTIWLAGITDNKDNLQSPFNNIRIELPKIKEDRLTKDNQDYFDYDFIGPEIDIGFRLAKLAQSGKVTVSSEFAYIVQKLDKTDYSNRFKIVSYEKLKGVREDKYYPVVWYYNNWSKIHSVFEYDDHIQNELVKNILEKKQESIKNLKKVYRQLNKEDDFNKILSEIENQFSKKNSKKDQESKEKCDIVVPVSGDFLKESN